MKTCSKKGPWHAWKLVRMRKKTWPMETIYRCRCGYLGIQTVFFEEFPPDPSNCEFEGGCKKLATHVAGNSIFCKKHAPSGAEGPSQKNTRKKAKVITKLKS